MILHLIYEGEEVMVGINHDRVPCGVQINIKML